MRAARRDRARKEVAAVALRLFVERGFDGVTALEVAEAAGVSPRTFFRYFATKEDAALAALEASQSRVADELRRRPRGEPVWASLKAAFAILEDALDLDSLEVARLYVRTPSLRASRTAKDAEWHAALLPVLIDRVPRAGGRWRRETAANALLVAALGCLDTATEVWVRSGGEESPGVLLDAAFDAITAASTASTQPGPHSAVPGSA